MVNKKIVLINLIFAIIILLSNISYAGILSSDIDGIDDSRYPKIKNMIKALQNQNPNYNFQLYYTGIDWNEAVTMEYQGHGKSPKNLFSYADGTYARKGKWYCPICGQKSYDTGRWYCASKEAIAYMMDPRNSLNSSDIFQFKTLESADASSDNLITAINNKYASYSYINNNDVINAIIHASNSCGINAYSVLTKIVQEQGKGTSPMATGAGYQGRYVGYYNFFNINAYGNGEKVYTNGLSYAERNNWNSAAASIIGGVSFYKNSYIGVGQNTLYYQRFNCVNERSLFSHQYQQNIMDAQSSCSILKSFYTTTGTLSVVPHTFIIPMYENMPVTPCGRPSTSENPVLNYEEAKVLTNKLQVHAAPTSARIVAALNENESVKVLSRATAVSSDGNYWDEIVSNTDGTYGYVLRSGISFSITLPKYIFDASYYSAEYEDLRNAYGNDEMKLYTHFMEYGIYEGRRASASFDLKYYLNNNSDLKEAFGNNYKAAYDHFYNNGCKEERKSSSEYDGYFYKYFYAEHQNMSSVELLNYYETTGRKQGDIAIFNSEWKKLLFDYKVYSSCNYDDVADLSENEEKLERHWLKNGIKEGRIASLIYDPKAYLKLNADVKDAFGEDYTKALNHFIQHGIYEYRRTSLVFDVITYKENYEDLRNVYGEHCYGYYMHFCDYGMKEGRNPSKVFEPKIYLSENTDLSKAFENDYSMAYLHYLNFGINEWRKTSSVFDVLYYKNNNEDLNSIYGNNNQDYIYHYVLFGLYEGRNAIEKIQNNQE